MIAEQIQGHSKYYQFYAVATILEHVIDCFHTIVSDETNPYHPPLSWFTSLGKQLRPPKDELFHNLIEECSTPNRHNDDFSDSSVQLSQNVRYRLEKCSREERKEIVSRSKEGCSPLFLACKLGHPDIARYLLEVCGADIEQKGRFEDPFAREDHHVHSVSPLWVAAVSGHLSIVKLLIDYKADINSISDTGSTPLRSTCFLCKDDDNGPILQPTDGDSTERFDQNESDDIYMNIVRLLVENSADVSRANYNGVNCLINSIHNYKLTEYILDHGCDIDATDIQAKTALHYAILQGRFEVTKLLLRRGANPLLRANNRDDALQLSCIGGHVDIFNHLLESFEYSQERLIDAYKLLGCSILEIRFDIAKVRELWLTSLKLESESHERNEAKRVGDELICDTRRSIAFKNATEFKNENELSSLTTDDFRIQSLIITERCLGSHHRETIQRLIYRGNCYNNSMRPDRCIDLWIYALKLRIQHESIAQHESIFQYEIIFAAKAISKMLLDQCNQRQQAKTRDIYDVLSLFIDQLDRCRYHFDYRPISRLHQDMYDLLLGVVLNLLLALHRTSRGSYELESARQLTKHLIAIDPRSSNGSSLLHLCLSPGVLCEERIYRPIASAERSYWRNSSSPLVELIVILLENGLEVDLLNRDGLSALQVLCLTSIRGSDKGTIAKVLVESGAHVDRRSLTPEHDELIRQALLENGVKPFDHVTLSCLSARRLVESNIKFDRRVLTRSLRKSIAIH